MVGALKIAQACWNAAVEGPEAVKNTKARLFAQLGSTITQEELAGMVGASRERVNKAIAAFIKLGWIQQVERRYVITNRRQLEIRAR